LYYLVAVIYDETIYFKNGLCKFVIPYFNVLIQNCVQMFSVLRSTLFSPVF